MKLNSTAKLAFFNARKREGDTSRLSETTGYPAGYITGVINGNRPINDTIANAMYQISSRRVKTSELA
jgi:hypothetical protein